ncbi:MAG: hypothetical protein EXR72_20950 [Myxococcales bacterium]|nr:hypothetical protein [Myxococcales bacterium]
MTRGAVVAAVMLVAVASGCRRSGVAERLVDEQLMLALEEARAWQHRADTHMADGEPALAIGDVQAVLKIRFPPGAAEGEEARLDAWARLAKLRLDAGGASSAEDEARALASVEEGRREATRDSFYRAHLETVAGEIFEARAKRLAADPEAAKAARREALAAYARSIAINQRVQAGLLKEAP